QSKQRRRGVRQDTLHQMEPADRFDVTRQQEPHVLKIALAPATIALHVLGYVGWQPFIAPFQVVREPDVPARVAHEDRFHEVVTEHPATQRLFTGQAWKSTAR